MKRLAVGAVLLAAACSTPQPRSPLAPSRDDAILLVTSSPSIADAEVWLDGANVGSVASVHRGLALAAGHHRIELRADGYFAGFREVDLQARVHSTVEITLMPSLP